MTRHWVAAPFHADLPDIWDRVWKFDVQHQLISIGWRELADFSSLDKDALMTALERAYPDKSSQARKLNFNMVWAFYHAIKPGDLIIARRGRKTIAAVGTVIGPPYYEHAKNMDASGPDHYYSNHLPVRWHATPRDKVLPTAVFGRQTLYEIAEDSFNKLVGKAGEATQVSVEPLEEGVEDATEFVLEKYLEDFIVTNFDAIFRGELVLYRDPEEGVEGQQYATEVGIIDILATEPRTAAFVVIELKKGRESDRVIGQILRYMGWVADNLATQSQPVRGIIVCRDTDPKLIYAVKMARNITMKYYNIDFKLADEPTR